MWRGGLGGTYRLPAPSFAGASLILGWGWDRIGKSAQVLLQFLVTFGYPSLVGVIHFRFLVAARRSIPGASCPPSCWRSLHGLLESVDD